MAAKLLTERFAFSGGRVDRTGPNPVLKGVLLCGPISINKRRYLKKAFEGDRVKRYADKPVYLNHGNDREDRRYEEQLGWVRNPRHRADGMPEGDIEVKKGHPYCETFLGDAENNPAAVGMSHMAHCQTDRGADGWEDVTEMRQCVSVDVVTNPATTTSLFENRNRGAGVALTVKAFCEALVKHPKTKASQVKAIKRVAEMDGMGDMPSAVEAPPADDATESDHEAAVDSAFESAGCAIWKAFTKGELDLKEVITKIKELAKGHTNVKGGKAAPADDEDDDEEEEVPKESKNKRAQPTDPYAVLAECKAAGYDPAPTELKYLATLTADERKTHLTEATAKGKGGANPSGASRRPGAGGAGPGAGKPVKEDAVTTGKPVAMEKWDEM